MTQPLENQPPFYTPEEYLAMEEQATERHEFWFGQLIMMSGGTFSHSSVIGNTFALLWIKLRGKTCRPVESNMRVGIDRNRFVYPDISVICGEPEFDPTDKKKTTIRNPTLVVEVLSDSTEPRDRGPKFSAYRDIVSLREYVLIAQDKPELEVYFRQPDGSWRFETHRGLDAVAKLRSIDVDLALAEVFERVTFDPPAV
jgi:Uma2 family endonuclease